MPGEKYRPPAENEIECPRCGTIVFYEVTRCPNCGVSFYEPEGENDPPPQKQRAPASGPGGIAGAVRDLFHRLFNKPYPADDLFGAALTQAGLFDDLLRKTAGDRAAAERLVDFERAQDPRGSRTSWLQAAIRRWERDNRVDS